MDLAYTAEDELFRQRLRGWLEKNLPEGWVSGNRDLPKDLREQEKFLKDWHRRLYEGGWMGLAWPKEYGGQGATLIEQLIYEEEMGRVEAPPLINAIGISNIGPTLIHIGTEEQRRKYVPKILSGEETWCQGYSEPNSGSDLASVQTRAERNGNQYIINGQKIWTSYSMFAQRCFVLARTSKGEKKHHGLTVFLVDMNQPGVEVRPIHQIDGGQKFSEVFFENAIVDVDDIVGEVDRGWEVAMFLLKFERVGAAQLSFRLQNIYKDLVKLAQTLKNGNQPLSKDPIIRQKLADFYARSLGSLLNYYRNLTRLLHTGQPGSEGSIDKLYTSELEKEICEYAVGLLSQGTTSPKEYQKLEEKWHYKWLFSFGTTIQAGTSEIQRNIIAERMLGLPKDIKN
jgi:alkylation response protein AidB-like acyl-CoA dehydrogenase